MAAHVGEAPRLVLCVQNLSVPKDPRVWREARTLALAGYNVTVVSPRDRGQARRETLDGIAIIRYGPAFRGTSPFGLVVEMVVGFVATCFHASALRARGRIDVLHVANPPDVLFPLGWVMQRLGAKLIFDWHDPTLEVLRAKLGERRGLLRVAAWLERRSLRAADAVLTVNGSCRRLALARGALPDQTVIVVRTGPDALAPAQTVPFDGKPRVVFAGIIGEQDGVEVLLRAVAMLKARGEDLLLEIIGDGPDLPRLQQVCVDLHIEAITDFAGWLPKEQMLARLASGTVAVSPDEDSELNRLASMLKIGDYLSQGVPVVASDLPETRVTCDDAVLYVTPGDADALADGIQRLLADEQLRASLRASGRARAERLLWPRSGERLLAVYRWLLRSEPPPAPDQTV